MPNRAPEPGPGAPALRTVAILPARLASRRLPRKMLLAATGRPLIVHTALSVERAQAIERVVVATDSTEILEAVRAAGHTAVMTSPDHPSGTDRVLEAVLELERDGECFDVVLNVQGDEPEIDPADLERLAQAFGDPDVAIATLAAPIESRAELEQTSVVKVVRDTNGDALYFSRAPIPSTAHARPEAGESLGLRHVGVYAFRPGALRRFCALPIGKLERAENLEQLRWLEAGATLRVIDAHHHPPGIDTAEDYEAFVARSGSLEGSESNR